MDAVQIDDLLWDLDSEELPAARRLFAAMKKAGWASSREVETWSGGSLRRGVSPPGTNPLLAKGRPYPPLAKLLTIPTSTSRS
jgi:hypothetical protein